MWVRSKGYWKINGVRNVRVCEKKMSVWQDKHKVGEVKRMEECKKEGDKGETKRKGKREVGMT